MKLENRLLDHIEESYLQKFGVVLKIKSSKLLGGGCINNALKLESNEGSFFLKWNSNGPDDLFIREEESLNEFLKSKNEFIIFPKPLVSKIIDKQPGYLLTSYLDQGNCGNDDEKLGRGLAQLHKVSNKQYGFVSNNYCGATLQDNSFKTDWLSFYTENRIAYIINLIAKTRGWSNSDVDTSDRFLHRIPLLLAHNIQPSLIHGDLWSGNYMYTTSAPALIDPCASYCDREFEMGIMTMFGGFSQRVYDAYNEFYPLNNDWKERNLVYQLYHVLNHYYLFGGYYKNQALDIMKHYL